MVQEQDNSINFKIPILHRTVPYVYIKINNFNNRYRLSCNYKYLNEHYGLQINFIRDLSKIDYPDNNYFSIINNKIILNKNEDVVNQSWEIGEGHNVLKIIRLIHNKCTIMLLHRIFEDDENYSIFYASNRIPNINTFLKDY